jgi:uncharacterized membrane protein
MRLGPSALLLLLLAAHAAAQGTSVQPEACRPPVLAVEQPSGPFTPGDAVSLLMAVENPNGAPVDSVRATLTTTAPAGWTATPAQRELTLGPKNVSITTLAVTAPNRGSGAGGGNVTILVTFVCTSGDIQTSASASETLSVALRAFAPPWPLVLGGFAVLAGGVTVLGLRRLQRGVAFVALGDAREVAPGRSVKFTFSVENRRGRPQQLTLVASDVPPGWALHLALETVELEPGEEKTIWVILKAPPQAQHAEEVPVSLRLLAGAREVAAADVRARVAVP